MGAPVKRPVSASSQDGPRGGTLATAGAFLLWLVGLFTASCTSYLTEVEDVYYQGRYLEVTETLDQRQNELAGLSVDQQARYCLYRGLALLHIGDRPGARRWLCLCHALEMATMAKLTPRQRALAREGRRAVGGCQGKARKQRGQRSGP